MVPHSQRPIIGCLTYQKQAAERAMQVVGIMPSYIEAVRTAGGIPVLIPLMLDELEMQAALRRMDGVLMPGGGDIDPQRYNGSGHAFVAAFRSLT